MRERAIVAAATIAMRDGEPELRLRSEAWARAIPTGVLLIAIEDFNSVAAAFLGRAAREFGGGHRMVQASIAVAETRDTNAQGHEQRLVAARAA